MNHDERNAAATASLMPRLREESAKAAPDARETDEDAFFRQRYRDAEYYSTGRDWGDYAPAYRYGRLAHSQHPGERFEDVEATLAGEWCAAKDVSRLLWAEARGAVLEAWHRLDDGGASRVAVATD